MADPTVTKPNVPESDGGKRPRRRWLRRLLGLTCVLIVVLTAIVLAVPTALSTDVGRRFVLRKVNDQIVGSVDADSLGLGWFSGQALSGLTVRGADGNEIVRVGRIHATDASLWSLISGGLSLGTLEVDSVEADFIGYDDGTTNLQRSLAMRGATAKPTGPGTPGVPSTPGVPGKSGRVGTSSTDWPGGLSFGLVLRDLDLAYRAHEADEPIRISIPIADLSATDPRHLEVNLDATLSQANRQGTIKVDAKIDRLFDSAGMYQPKAVAVRVNAQVDDMPVGLLDDLTGQGGMLSALIGPIINAQVVTDATAAGGTAMIEAVSENLGVNGRIAFDPDGLTNVGTSQIHLTLTPDAWSLLTASDGKPASTLTAPVKLAIELRRLGLPFSEDGIDLGHAGIDMGLAIGDAHLQIQDVGGVTFTSTTGEISATQLGELLTATFDSISSINRKPGAVGVEVVVADLIDKDQQINTAGLSAKINGQLTNAPIAAVLDELLPGVTHGLATRTLGPVAQATVHANLEPRTDGGGVAGDFDVDLVTTGGEAGLTTTLIGRFDTKNDAVQAALHDGSFVKFTATPGLVSAYADAFNGQAKTPVLAGNRAKPTGVTLAGPATFRLDLNQADATIRSTRGGAYALDMASVRLLGKLTSPRLRLAQAGKPAATLHDLRLDVATQGLAGDTTLTLAADIDYPASDADEPKPGVVRSTTTVVGLINVQGNVDPAGASYQTDTLIRQAPIDLIDALLDMQGDLAAAVGPRARLVAKGSYAPDADNGSGGIDLELASDTAKADAKLLLRDGKWVLEEDAPLSFRVTPRLSQNVLRKVMPFLGGAVSAKLPIGVTVMSKGFSLPLKAASVGDVDADMRLELGELDLKGEGALKALLGQFDVSDRSLLNARFSPVTVNLTGGKLSYADFTMTVEGRAFSFSGEVDLNTNRLDLRMTVPGSDVVIPLTGTIDKPKLDMAAIGLAVGRSLLQRQVKDSVGRAIRDKVGGEAGKALGGLLGDLLGEAPPKDTGEDQSQAPDQSQDPAQDPLQPQETPLTPEQSILRWLESRQEKDPSQAENK